MRHIALFTSLLLASTIASAQGQNGSAAAAQPATAATQASKPDSEKPFYAAIRLPKAIFAANEDLNFTVSITNNTDKGWLLYDVAYFWGWQTSFKNLKTGDIWSIRPLFEAKRQATDTFLNPGKSIDLPTNFQLASRRFDFVTKRDGKTESTKTLPPGKYKLQVNINVNTTVTNQSEYQPWEGVLKTAEVDLEITEPGK